MGLQGGGGAKQRAREQCRLTRPHPRTRQPATHPPAAPQVMELVVGLSKYVGTPGIEPVFAEWVAGYAEGGGTLTRAEADLVPDLIILR